MTDTVQHPGVLSDEDGEQMWVREDLAPDGDVEVIRAVIRRMFDLGSEETDCYGEPSLCEMRRATHADVEDGLVYESQRVDGWYVPVLQGRQPEVRYWRVTV